MRVKMKVINKLLNEFICSKHPLKRALEGCESCAARGKKGNRENEVLKVLKTNFKTLF
jgi:hypothetical protein